MNEFEQKISDLSKRFDYPSTPDISANVMKKIRQPRFMPRRLVWPSTFVLILLISLFAIPPVRAAIFEFLQIGIVRIFPQDPQSTEKTVPSITPAPSVLPLLDLVFGKTTLTEASERVDYPILLPRNFGEPDYVFIQDAEGYMTILAWMNPNQPQSVELSLHFIPNASWAITKMGPKVLQETVVNDYKAVWAEGSYPLFLYNHREIAFTRLIEGNVLIWTDGIITYRLEINLSMEEAIEIAESLEPIN